MSISAFRRTLYTKELSSTVEDKNQGRPENNILALYSLAETGNYNTQALKEQQADSLLESRTQNCPSIYRWTLVGLGCCYEQVRQSNAVQEQNHELATSGTAGDTRCNPIELYSVT